jgi:3-deoxy-D-arabino-heptulosonate 7-phosphate (DAHP) synthase
MPISVIKKSGQEIVYIDYRGLREHEDMMRQLEDTIAFVKQNTVVGNMNRVIIDFRDAVLDKKFMAAMKEAGKRYFIPAGGKHVVLGASGIRMIILNAYNRISGGNVRAFASEEEAYAYLCD